MLEYSDLLITPAIGAADTYRLLPTLFVAFSSFDFTKTPGGYFDTDFILGSTASFELKN